MTPLRSPSTPRVQRKSKHSAEICNKRSNKICKLSASKFLFATGPHLPDAARPDVTFTGLSCSSTLGTLPVLAYPTHCTARRQAPTRYDKVTDSRFHVQRSLIHIRQKVLPPFWPISGLRFLIIILYPPQSLFTSQQR
jgi:hypothetical protein